MKHVWLAYTSMEDDFGGMVIDNLKIFATEEKAREFCEEKNKYILSDLDKWQYEKENIN